MKTIRWGIVGTGAIADIFSSILANIDKTEIVAIASRTKENADAFAEPRDIPNRHVGIKSLAADPDVDVVYIATPHPFHKYETTTCLEAGKPVLCEKPFAMNASEAEAMIICAKQHDIFLMEAMWTHFLPALKKLTELIKEKCIGELLYLESSIGFIGPKNIERIWLKELGGGALLDIGVYLIAFAQLVFGEPPEKIQALTRLTETGVDASTTMLFGYNNGAIASMTCAINTELPCCATIYGTNGSIVIPSWNTETLLIRTRNKPEEIMNFDSLSNKYGYRYQALEVMRCLRAGEKESPGMPLNKTMTIMKTMDAVRTATLK